MNRDDIAKIIDAIDAKSLEVDGEAIETAASKAAKNLYLKRIRKKAGRVVLAFLCLALIVTGIMVVKNKVQYATAYTIKSGDTSLCYVSSKGAADKVINKLVNQYKPEGTNIKAIENNYLETEPADPAKVKEVGVTNVDEAVAYIDEYIKAEKDEEHSITVISSKMEILPYTPEPDYEKDDSVLAGESYVKVEGKDGKQEVTTFITTVNGKICDQKVSDTKILDKGKKATICKGTLGLPRGEDWKTYEGDPVFNDAQDLIKTCKQYMGAPYKYGGKSLTNGIDCVQYIRQMFAKYGVSIPNRHKDIQKVGKGVKLKDAQPGDIVCWTHHVGIYVGNGKVINATRAKGVTISSVYMKKTLVTVRRVPRN